MALAQLQYQLPRLTRMWSHLERQAGGRVRGMGEKQLEVDKRLMRTRIGQLQVPGSAPALAAAILIPILPSVSCADASGCACLTTSAHAWTASTGLGPAAQLAPSTGNTPVWPAAKSWAVAVQGQVEEVRSLCSV